MCKLLCYRDVHKIENLLSKEWCDDNKFSNQFWKDKTKYILSFKTKNS